MSEKIKKCKCGKYPRVFVRGGTLQIVCDCGRKGRLFFGDYQNESFMKEIYGQDAIAIGEWNRMVENE